MSKLKSRYLLSLPNRESGTILPATLAAILIGIAGIQLMLTTAPELPDTAFVPSALSKPQPIAARSVAVPDAIISRNLFAPSRGRPSDAAVALPLGGTIVAGTVRSGRGYYAVVIAPGGVVSRVYPGGRVSGWRLVRLSADQAYFARGGEKLAVPFGGQGGMAAPTGQDEAQ